MKAHCERQGQVEIGVIEIEGREFRALGASVQGNYVSGYLNKRDELTTFCGQTMLSCRSERVGDYWTERDGDTFGIVFYLTGQRAIVGYCFGVGSLFRGELIDLSDSEPNGWQSYARHQCSSECEYWLNIDAEDYERDQAEQLAEIES